MIFTFPPEYLITPYPSGLLLTLLLNLMRSQATLKDREWDQFKEDNPKGWGNKNKMG